MASDPVLPSLEALTTLLQCSVCLDVPRGKAVQCVKGHHVCATCYEGLDARQRVCPVGRCHYSPEPHNSLIVAQFVDLLQYKFACVNQKAGCEESLSKEGLKDHEEYCGYRTVACMFTEHCSFRCNSLASHVLEKHPSLRCRTPNPPFSFQKRGERIYTPSNTHIHVRRRQDRVMIRNVNMFEEENTSHAKDTWTSTGSDSFFHQVSAEDSLQFVSRMALTADRASFLIQADLSNTQFDGLISEIRLCHPDGVNEIAIRGQVFDLGDSVESMLQRQVCSVPREDLEKLIAWTSETGKLLAKFDLVKKE